MWSTNVLPRGNEIGVQWAEPLREGCGVRDTHTQRVARLIQLKILRDKRARQKKQLPAALPPRRAAIPERKFLTAL